MLYFCKLILKRIRLASMSRNTISNNTIFIIMVAISIGVGIILFPPISDDINFMMPYRCYLNDAEGSLSQSIADGITFWWNHDNGRLANFISIVSFWMPRWILGLISTAVIGLVIAWGAKIGRFYNNSFLLAVFIVFFLFLFPWVDQLYLINFQINYIWPLAISLWLLMSWLRNRVRFSFAEIIVCLILGFWHEGLACGMFLTLIALIIFYKRYHTSRFCFDAVAFVPGLIVLTHERIFAWHGNYFTSRMNILYLFALPLMLFLLLMIAVYIKRFRAHGIKTDRMGISPTMFALFVTALTGILFMLYVPTGPRTGTLGIYACFIGICAILNNTVFRKNSGSGAVRRWCTVVLCGLIALHLILVDIECYKAGNYTKSVLSEYRLHPEKVHYIEMTMREDSPLLCAQKPYYDWFAHLPTIGVFNKFYGIPDYPIKVAPAELENIDTEKLRVVPGTAGIMTYGKYIVGPAVDDTPTVRLLEIIGEGKKYDEEYYVMPLDNTDGLAWYYPNHSSIFRKKPSDKFIVNAL